MARVLLPILATVALCGCVETLDSVTLRAGNAKNANAAIMTVDPQAHRADDVAIVTDGVVVAEVIADYREGPRVRPAQASADAGTSAGDEP